MTDDMKMILEKLNEMDAKITDIQLTLEDETNKNVQIIADRVYDCMFRI